MSKNLKFIHITKTAGSSIEKCALKKGVKWGINDPELNVSYNCQIHRFWHVPLYLISDTNYLSELEKKYDFFAVVRDPFERCISEFYFMVRCMDVIEPQIYDNPVFMNQYIQKAIREDPNNGHWVKQVRYIYHPDSGRQMVQHVLRFENLEKEFGSLMKEYGLDIHLNEKELFWPRKMGVQDLTPETRELIRNYYREDFQTFNYPLN